MNLSSEERNIWAAVDHIVRSEPFKQSKRLPAFLRYVVKEALEGRGDRIKSFSIALEVFGHEPDGEVSVRTTAARLRAALDKYYEIHKDDVEIMITLPKGRYIPAFIFLKTKPIELNKPPHEKENKIQIIKNTIKKSRKITYPSILLITILFITAACFGFHRKMNNETQNMTILVLNTSADKLSDNIIAKNFNHHLLSDMVEMGTAKIISVPETQLSQLSIAGDSAINYPEPTLALSTDLFDDQDGGISVTWHLSNPANGTVLWVDKDHVKSQEASGVSGLGSAVAFSVLGVDGAVNSLSSRLADDLDGRWACIPQSMRLSIVFDEMHQGRMMQCIENLAKKQPNEPMLWGMLAQIYTYYSELQASKGNDYIAWHKKAKEAADKAVTLAPKSFLTRQAELLTAFNAGETIRFKNIAHELLQQYPGDPNLKVRIGSHFVRLADYAEGKRLILEGISEKKTSNLWDNISLSLANYGNGAYSEAILAVDKASGAQSYLQHLIRAISLADLDRIAEAKTEIDKLLQYRPNYANDAYKDAKARNLSAELTERISNSLRKAGLQIRK
ncbi:hypothetical protein M8994_11420 [Brucella sp. 21LCYQ03]|nr:hypothetical protein [Brucella sp. 21LCYQ03]